MSNPGDSVSSRRKFIRLSAGGLALIPVVNLLGCSDNGSGPAATAPQKAPSEAAPAPTQAAPSRPPEADAPAGSEAPQTGAGTQLVKLEESDPTAQALAYRHSAEQVDKAQYPRFEAGQICGNCNLYQAAAGAEEGWGGCSIFPGKLVNVNGWCNAYVGRG